MRIDEALAETKELDVKFGTAVLHVVYQQSNYTIAEMEEMEGRRKERGYLVKMMQDLVKAWDLTRALKDDLGNDIRDDDGKIVEVPVDVTNPEDVRLYVTSPVIVGILRAIKEDQGAGEA